MKAFKILSTILLLSLFGSATAFAASDSWEEERPRYTIYFDGGYSETLFSNLQTPRTGAQITNVEWDWVGYSNGYDNQIVEMCYRAPYSYTSTNCLNISDSSTGATSAYNGFNPRGTIVLRFILSGGTYYAYGTSGADDKIKVTYSY
ncbi:hypothetical protein [Alteromonas stellipolaris]|uniref:hypothetical protein n=1 Tax=Alteromonas stellipolaris TaxID=233316 RepID=UPI001DECBA5C|nr:hypothetical protein [Alteromonas stellipolaris]MBZ2164270.1 hypothetical protein [Alteromonas stellipolaris]